MKASTTYYTYTHTDHLGSIVAITYKNPTTGVLSVIDRRSYDVWAKPRNVNDWND